MNISKAKEYILRRLKEETSLDYYYHNVQHTIDVWRSATRFSRMEDVSEHDWKLIETASLYHDSGMLDSYANHEEASVEIVKKILPQFDYTQEEIESISSMIMTTKLPQSANTKNEMILCDADLDYLGRDDFFMIAQGLRLEWNILKVKPTTLAEWYKIQIGFMEAHQFFTPSAKLLRDERKEYNLNLIKELLNHQ